MSEEVKKRGKDPEFMKMMRERAIAKKAEQKKIRDAEKLKQQLEHKEKLAQAETLLNPKPTPIEKQEPMEEKAETKPKPKETPINYKQEYYRHKLELLKEQKQKPEPSTAQSKPINDQPLPHKLLKREFMNDINKTVMRELWKRHFGGEATPYD